MRQIIISCGLHRQTPVIFHLQKLSKTSTLPPTLQIFLLACSTRGHPRRTGCNNRSIVKKQRGKVHVSPSAHEYTNNRLHASTLFKGFYSSMIDTLQPHSSSSYFFSLLILLFPMSLRAQHSIFLAR